MTEHRLDKLVSDLRIDKYGFPDIWWMWICTCGRKGTWQVYGVQNSIELYKRHNRPGRPLSKYGRGRRKKTSEKLSGDPPNTKKGYK